MNHNLKIGGLYKIKEVINKSTGNPVNKSISFRSDLFFKTINTSFVIYITNNYIILILDSKPFMTKTDNFFCHYKKVLIRDKIGFLPVEDTYFNVEFEEIND